MAASDDGYASSGYTSSDGGQPPSNDGNPPSHVGNSSLDNGRTLSGAEYLRVPASTIRRDGTIDTKTEGVEPSLYHIDEDTISNFSKELAAPSENACERAQLSLGLEMVASYLFTVKRNANSQFTKMSESTNDSIWKIFWPFDNGENMAGQYLLGAEKEPKFLHESIGEAKVRSYVNELFPGWYKPFQWAKEPVAATQKIGLDAWGYQELVDPDGINTKDIIPGYVVKVKIGKILLERPSTWHHLAIVFQWSKEKSVAEKVEIAE